MGLAQMNMSMPHSMHFHSRVQVELTKEFGYSRGCSSEPPKPIGSRMDNNLQWAIHTQIPEGNGEE